MGIGKPSNESRQFDMLCGKKIEKNNLERLDTLKGEQRQAVSNLKSILNSPTIQGDVEKLDPTGDMTSISIQIENTKANLEKIQKGLKIIQDSQDE